jgi:protein-S-isoprenylcysteine O-methyltransferase Ste14
MPSETNYRIAFFGLLVMLIAMRSFFMVKVRRSGGRLMPDKKAVEREGGPGALFIRMTGFFLLTTFLVMYFIGATWINAFSFPLPDRLRWAGFVLGIISVGFWTWTQTVLDTQWSAQLQLTEDHHLITTGPYARIRHPLYAGMLGWSLSLAVLTANWIFVAICILVFAGLSWRIPKEEQMMIEAFGDEYRVYMQRTGRLFPKF